MQLDEDERPDHVDQEDEEGPGSPPTGDLDSGQALDHRIEQVDDENPDDERRQDSRPSQKIAARTASAGEEDQHAARWRRHAQRRRAALRARRARLRGAGDPAGTSILPADYHA